ncbi:kinase-like domain-containing protein [Gigaspora rosea]|uniref:Kinase-like domain-containing protein n=1 Tax=Gigaspora rosea TaxID=44941 RepID=A0A397V0V0_9GLOM|nr:kinase-like domain-containing protein [Gigaspora rosea]
MSDKDLAEKIYKSYEVIENVVEINKTLGISNKFTDTAEILVDAAKPFVPMLSLAISIVTKIMEIYNNAQYNKKICSALMDRVISAEAAIKILQQRKSEYEPQFQDIGRQKSFLRFISSLEKIKIFAEEVTQIRGFNKYLKATDISQKFRELTKEYEESMNDLKFSMVISFDEQRRIDDESLKSDLNEMNKELDLIKSKLLQPIPDVIDVQKVDPKLLQDPFIGNYDDVRKANNKIVKKQIYKQAIEVACISYDSTIFDQKKHKKENMLFYRDLEILGKLIESPNIIKFYGLSEVDNSKVMVFEWAEMGNLRECYLKYPIPLNVKVDMALKICRGIVFLNAVGIFHHDLRCKNIMVTDGYTPKLANFKYARAVTDKTTSIDDVVKLINWMAPEKMIGMANDRYVPYTLKCEIFSFGMLLWELVNRKIPYEQMSMNDVISYVTKGYRENCFIKPAQDEIIQKDFIDIIESTWKKIPQERISLPILYLKLSELDKKTKSGNLSMNHESSKESSAAGSFRLLTFEEAIKIHNNYQEKRKLAYESFKANSELGHPMAMYYHAYYLSGGYYTDEKRTEDQKAKDKIEARELYKKAADEGIADAQLRYAFELGQEHSEFINYLTKAADNGNLQAMYNLAKLYLNGKCNVQKDNIVGLRYLKLAAMKGHKKALNEIESMDAYDYF